MSKLNKSKCKSNFTVLKLFTTEAPNLVGLEEFMMNEDKRRVTVVWVSDSAIVIKINSKDILPKLKEHSIKEFIQYAKTKISLTEEIISNYTQFQINLYKRVKNDELLRTSCRNNKYLSEQPTHIAVKMSMSNIQDPMRSKSTMRYNSSSVSKIPSLTSMPRLDYTRISHANDNNQDSTIQELILLTDSKSQTL